MCGERFPLALKEPVNRSSYVCLSEFFNMFTLVNSRSSVLEISRVGNKIDTFLVLATATIEAATPYLVIRFHQGLAEMLEVFPWKFFKRKLLRSRVNRRGNG